MPYLDGYLLINVLQQRRPFPESRVIFLTTMAADGEPGRDWTQRIDIYLLKPTNHWQVVLAVEQLLFGPCSTEWYQRCRKPPG